MDHNHCTLLKDEHHSPSLFAALADRWWDEEGPLAALHSMHPLRMSFILKHCDVGGSNQNFLDVGCGCGITSESLARMGVNVTAIDSISESIKIATKRAKSLKLKIKYLCGTLSDMPIKSCFSTILMFEVLEHVQDYEQFLEEAIALLDSGGFLFISTINKTLSSFIADILIAEYVCGIAEPGTHQWNDFIPYEKLIWILKKHGQILEALGLKYNPINNTWRFSRMLNTNYILAFRKN